MVSILIWIEGSAVTPRIAESTDLFCTEPTSQNAIAQPRHGGLAAEQIAPPQGTHLANQDPVGDAGARDSGMLPTILVVVAAAVGFDGNTRAASPELTAGQASPVLLGPDDIHGFISAELARAPRRDLHKLARGVVNDIASSGPQNGVAGNFDDYSPWREYVAQHTDASRIIGTGVVRAFVEFSANAKDPNRA